MSSVRGERSLLSSGLMAAAWALAAVWLLLTVYPVIWVALTALKDEPGYVSDPWGLPGSPKLANFASALAGKPGFATFYLNGLIVTSVAVIATVVASALAGYALARIRFRGGSLLFGALALGLALPVHATLIPLHRMENALGLYDSLAGLILPYAAFSLPVGVVIFRGFFLSIPPEIEEAARIDGAGRLRVIFQVVLPLARPAVATVVIFTAVSLWNEYAFALTLLESPGNFTVPLGLTRFSSEHAANVPLTCAGVVMSLAPVVLVYLAAGRHVTRGLIEGAIR